MEKIEKRIYRENLFKKHILVASSEYEAKSQESVYYTLLKKFGIMVDEGIELLNLNNVHDCQDFLGYYVPEPFYRNFPASVYELSSDQLLFDKIFNYFKTYGLNNFNEETHSIFEKEVEEKASKEVGRIKHFKVISLEEAKKEIEKIVDNFLCSTRPLSTDQYYLVTEFVEDFEYLPEKVVSHDTAAKLAYDTSLYFAKFLTLSDIVKVLDYVNNRVYKNNNLKKLNLKNADRKFFKQIIDYKVNNSTDKEFEREIKVLSEKKKIWNGFLHHIHYKATNDKQRKLLEVVRGNENYSSLSTFERKMSNKDYIGAANVLSREKGTAYLLRHINYIASRCSNVALHKIIKNELKEVKNPIVLMQLYMSYYSMDKSERTFNFVKNELLKSHRETSDEVSKRKSVLSDEKLEILREDILTLLKNNYKNKLGKVYLGEEMKKIAVPIQETTSSSGFGVLPKGSRIPIGNKSVRAFIYWEKVNDIDLSGFLLNEDGKILKECSWRTSHDKAPGITFSGDCTSGYTGGSEYYDFELDKIKAANPEVRYILLTANNYSASKFSNAICRAGFMLREELVKGKIFDPKTVETSFTINCDSNYAYLYVIDMDTEEVIWLNLGLSSMERVAGNSININTIKKYFDILNTFNMYDLFKMMASEVVTSKEDADIVVSNDETVPDGKTIIRSYDLDKIMAIMN